MALLGASIWYAVGQQNAENWRALADVDPVSLAALVMAILFSTICLPGLQFWIATRPFVTTKPLKMMTMQGLLAGTALLNYTPFKAGLIGRIAYLRYFHGVGLRAAVISHLLIAVVFVATCAITLAITLWRVEFDWLWWATVIAAFIAVILVGAPLLGIFMPEAVPVDPRMRDSKSWRINFLAQCLLSQGLGLFATAVRWWLVFRILDKPISLGDAWLAAVVHMVTVMGAPANGLGLREWLIGIVAERGLLSTGLEANLGAGVAAALVDRAAEAVVLVVAGLFGLALIRRGLGARKAATANARVDAQGS